MLLFSFLRPSNKYIYAPKAKYHRGEKAPPPTSKSIFGWIPALVHTKEDLLLDLVGLDAVTFLRFLRLCRQMFTGIAILAGGMLIPVNTLYNLRQRKSQNQDVLTRSTLRDVYGGRLWLHIACTYLITFFVIGLIWFHWQKMVCYPSLLFQSST